MTKKNTSKKASAAKAKKKAAPKKRIKPNTNDLLRLINDKIDIIDIRLRTIQSYETLQAAMKEHEAPLAPECDEAWPEIKVGDKVVPGPDNTSSWPKDEVRKVHEVDRSGHIVTECSLWTYYEGNRWVRLATPEEIQAHEQKKQWAEVSELQENDAVKAPYAELCELHKLAKDGGLGCDWDIEKYPTLTCMFLKWDLIGGRTKGDKGIGPWYNYLPIEEFRRRLLGTIEAKRKEKEERELKEKREKLKFGTLVKWGTRIAVVIRNEGADYAKIVLEHGSRLGNVPIKDLEIIPAS